MDEKVEKELQRCREKAREIGEVICENGHDKKSIEIVMMTISGQMQRLILQNAERLPQDIILQIDFITLVQMALFRTVTNNPLYDDHAVVDQFLHHVNDIIKSVQLVSVTTSDEVPP